MPTLLLMLFQSTCPTHSPPSHHSSIKSGYQTDEFSQYTRLVPLGNSAVTLFQIYNVQCRLDGQTPMMPPKVPQKWRSALLFHGLFEICFGPHGFKSSASFPPPRNKLSPVNWAVPWELEQLYNSLSFLKMAPSTLCVHLHILLFTF